MDRFYETWWVDEVWARDQCWKRGQIDPARATTKALLLINQSLVFCAVNGVELFFNTPVHRLPKTFTYHVITVSTHYHIVADATDTVQQVECSTDFLGQLRLFLNQGWKLVDICIDYTAIAEGT